MQTTVNSHSHTLQDILSDQSPANRMRILPRRCFLFQNQSWVFKYRSLSWENPAVIALKSNVNSSLQSCCSNNASPIIKFLWARVTLKSLTFLPKWGCHKREWHISSKFKVSKFLQASILDLWLEREEQTDWRTHYSIMWPHTTGGPHTNIHSWKR